MKKKLHWLSPGKNSDCVDTLLNSNLASTRLRTAVAYQSLTNNNYQITVGDSILSDSLAIVIGKVGANVDRFEYWKEQIKKHKINKSIIYLDYTDNHLGFDSPMRKYYEYFLEVSDYIIVPSEKMQDNISIYWGGPVKIIPDIIEFDFLEPKNYINSVPQLLWFGHASNIEFLTKYIQKENIINNVKLHLIVMSNINGIQILNNSISNCNLSKNMTSLIWSKNLMSEVARKTDICIIPSSQEDPRKSGVSSNRLLSSLALGLPTLSTSMPSYQEFNKYFLDIDLFSIEYMINNIGKQQELVANSQKEVLERFTNNSIGKLWFNLIESQMK